jgi:hypothetical protein
MKNVFADTHYFIALLNEDDEAHRKAIETAALTDVRTFTTEWVFTSLEKS